MKRSTLYLSRVAILSALSAILHLFKFPIFPVPLFNFLELDFGDVPALFAGFSLNPLAAVIVILIKNIIKIMTQGGTAFFMGDLSNIIVSLAFILPATIIYQRTKNKKGMFVGLAIATVSCLIVSTLSNYFVILPLSAAAGVPGINEEPIKSLFAFGYGLGFNAIKCVVNVLITVFLLFQKQFKILNIGLK